ncbi:MAG: hypothetical protein C0P79_012710 [Gammaproteobacteria bacterium]|nr:hypothetical protein [Gammaproteobacteria bacterium]
MASSPDAINRFVTWLLGVGSVCTGGMLLWMGSTLYQLSITMARIEERFTTLQSQYTAAINANSDTARSVRELAERVQRLEAANRAAERARRPE